jgi:hypothetical protein
MLVIGASRGRAVERADRRDPVPTEDSVKNYGSRILSATGRQSRMELALLFRSQARPGHFTARVPLKLPVRLHGLALSALEH